jgi:hypothetical protein
MNMQRETIVRKGTPNNPQCFPRDSSGHCFPTSIFFKDLPNGEKVKRDWLVWSSSTQRLFCFACCLFQDESISQASQQEKRSQLTRSDAGVKDNWRKLYEKIEAHQRSSAHITCYLTWKDLEKSLNESVGIDNSLQKQYATEIRKWQEVFRCILDVVLFLSERNLPFRGSTTKLDDPNNGLFLGNLELLSSHNQVLKMHLNEVKRNQETETRMQAHYLSWRSQNEFIQECANIVINAIIDEVKRALYYSIIVDGTPDTSHTEQITFILRYVHLNEENLWEVSERFLQMEDCEKKKGCDIAELICKVLKEHNIPLKNCRGQRYDNGSNMSGCYKGAQSLIREKNPQAVFCPCSAHTLNLCGVHTAESNNVVKNFFGNIQKLYNLFSCSPSRWKILQEIAHISLHKL